MTIKSLLLTLACSVTLAGCGDDGFDGTDGLPGASGQDGTNGSDGADGSNGADGANGENGSDGQDGENGEDGDNGHSIVMQARSATRAECKRGGVVFEYYIDLDDSLDVTDGDQLQTSVIECNGKAPKVKKH